MRILISDQGKIPAFLYGGTERVIWYLGWELSQMGHEVTFLVKEGSECPFARVIALKEDVSPMLQIPDDVDLVHFHYPVPGECPKPVIFTNHGNRNHQEAFHQNTVFVSANHANRYGSDCFVHNGLRWEDYGSPNLDLQDKYFHFLGNAAWKVKNLKGAINLITSMPREKLAVLGGHRFNFKMGMRFTLNPRIRFYGMVGGSKKNHLINQSKGLVFPVRWHEPFGLAIIESLYLGCPVFGTPYGSLPELVPSFAGHLSAHSSELKNAMMDVGAYSRKQCHEYSMENFHSLKMASKYLSLYEKVLNNLPLNHTPPVLLQSEPKYLPWE